MPDRMNQFDDTQNDIKGLQHISRKDPNELKDILSRIPGNVEIIQMYYAEGRHWCWFLSPMKLKEIKVKEK